MLELISLAKDNAILVIGLLAVTFYLEGRIDSESSATRQELSAMRTEIVGIKGGMSGFSQEVSSIRQEVSSIRQEVSSIRQEVSSITQEVSSIRRDLHLFQLESTDRFARIETLLGEPAQAM